MTTFMKDKIKWGIIGTGRMAGWFSKGLEAVGDAEKYAVASRTAEKAGHFAEKHGFKKAYGSYEEMILDDEVDIIYIATPIREHYRCIKMCLEGGKHVLCEKCITVNTDELEEVIRIAREKKLFLMEAMWMKCQPVFRQIRESISAGLLGDIKAVDCHFYTAAGKGHRLYRHELAGGALLDLGYYPVTAAVALLGMYPEKVQSHMVIQNRVDLQDSIILEYKNGNFAHLACGLGTEKSARLYILGTKGRITIQDDLFFQAQKAVAMDFDNEILAEFQGIFQGNGYEYEAMEAQKCLREHKTESTLVPLEESLAAMKILDSCCRQNGLDFSDK